MIIQNEDIILATIEGQTRAMNRNGLSVRLDYRRTMEMFAIAAARYAQGSLMVEALEYALDMNEPFESDDERYGYKAAMGIHFNRRKQAGIRMIKELERTRPFAPR